MMTPKILWKPFACSLLAAFLATLYGLHASMSVEFLGELRNFSFDYYNDAPLIEAASLPMRRLEMHHSTIVAKNGKREDASLDGGKRNHDDDEFNPDVETINPQHSTANQRTQGKPTNKKEWKELNEQLTEQRVIDFFRETPKTNFTFSNSTTRIYLIHVGKTAGSFLYQKLGIKTAKKGAYINCHLKDNGKSFDDCLGPLGRGPTQLWRLTVGHRHLAGIKYNKPQQRYLRNNGTNLLLWTVRDPVARVISAYNHHRNIMLLTDNPKGKKFFGCFENIEALAQATTPTAWANLTEDCRQQGYRFLKGTHWEPGRHMLANYRYYVTEAWRPGKAIAVLRTENLEQDTKDLERRLGGDPANLGEFGNDVKRKIIPSNSSITPEGKHLICCAIVEEMPFFEKIILLSINLEHHEKIVYLRASRQECGISVDDNQDGDESDIAIFSWEKWHGEFCPNITLNG